MSLPHWNASLELGVPEIDSDHKHLIDLVCKATELSQGDADRDEIWAVLVELEEYTRHHFEREEALMRHIGYEFTDHHTSEHDHLKLDVKNIMEDFLADRVTVQVILNFLERWLLRHIGGSDTLLAAAIKRQP